MIFFSFISDDLKNILLVESGSPNSLIAKNALVLLLAHIQFIQSEN